MYFHYLIKSLSAVAVLFLFFSRSNYAEKLYYLQYLWMVFGFFWDNRRSQKTRRRRAQAAKKAREQRRAEEVRKERSGK